MKISVLIEKLSLLQAEHGDLRCVTPGFDESGQDDIDTVDIVWIIPNVRSGGHSGPHDEVKQGIAKAEKAVIVNF